MSHSNASVRACVRACMRACVHVGECKCIRGVCAYVRVRVLVFACMRVRARVYVRESSRVTVCSYTDIVSCSFLNSTSTEINLKFLKNVHALSSASFSCNVAIVGADPSRQQYVPFSSG